MQAILTGAMGISLSSLNQPKVITGKSLVKYFHRLQLQEILHL